jgi:hypothetical protein
MQANWSRRNVDVHQEKYFLAPLAKQQSGAIQIKYPAQEF